MEIQGNYESRVEALVRQWDAKIEELKIEAQDAGPERSAQIDEEISVLIANREAARRGLLRVSEEGELCSSCPE